MVVPRSKLAEVEDVAVATAAGFAPADPITGTEPAGTAGQRGPAAARSRLHQQGHRRRRAAHHRRHHAPGGTREGLLHAADDLLRRPQRHDHRPRGDLRSGALDHPLRHRRRGDRDRERLGVRTGRRRLGRDGREGLRGRAQDPHRSSSRSTAARSIRWRPSVATSSRASGASAVSTASKSSSK